jgi:hypothetical protein
MKEAIGLYKVVTNIKAIVGVAVFLAALAIGNSGCTDADKGQIRSFGSRFSITQFSGGKVIGQRSIPAKCQV